MENINEPHKLFDTLLVLDFGSQYSHLITRNLRDLNVYSEMLPCTQRISELAWEPHGIILSGGPYSVYQQDAPHVDPSVFELGIPVLGICYGLQEMAWHHGKGKGVVAGEKREYGHADVHLQNLEGKAPHVSKLLEGFDDMRVWMSHGDKLEKLPPSFVTIATTQNAPFAGIAHEEKPFFGIQFHPEVTHTQKGKQILENFAVKVCKARQNWTMAEFVDKEIARIRALVGEKGQVIGAVSGGVDSTVAAKLMTEAIGGRFHAVMVDNGLLRRNEAKDVRTTLTEGLGIDVTVVDASERFLEKLKKESDPEVKRRIIGEQFDGVFAEKALEMSAKASGSPDAGDIEWLVQGTLYPDVIESFSLKGSAPIKTHHNVGGMLKTKFKLIEPLRELFKDEVRALGIKLGLSEGLVWRHPFPGPGLGIRVLGEVTPEGVVIARKADDIFMQEIRDAGLYNKISQALAALNPTKVVGVKGDKRVFEQQIILRAVETTDFMTASKFERRQILGDTTKRNGSSVPL